MGFSCGIVGLPNVGKSTLFNALTKANAPSSNYPFCTIDPNIGIVNVPDERLFKLAELVSAKKVTPTTVKFVDIAGLVKGANQGEGLGNQFLSNIRNVDAIVQIVRLFKNPDVIHIGSVDPVRDIEIVNLELMLKDMETLDNILQKKSKSAKAGDKEAVLEIEILEKVRQGLSNGILMKNQNMSEEEKKIIKAYQFLTGKELLIVANVDETELHSYKDNLHYQKLKNLANEIKADILVLSARIEQEISELSPEESKEYLESLGLKESGLEALVKEGYKLLGLITFFTVGEKETKAWTIRSGSKALEAAGVIHTDMEKGFIRAEVANYEGFIKEGGWSGLRDKGLVRSEGRDYTVQDGDILLIRFSV